MIATRSPALAGGSALAGGGLYLLVGMVPLALGVIAFLLALHAEGVFASAEQASAFGSAGALALLVFGLFTSLGGAWAGHATLGAGLTTYLDGIAIAAPYPYLSSLAAALTAFPVVALLERRVALKAGGPTEYSK